MSDLMSGNPKEALGLVMDAVEDDTGMPIEKPATLMAAGQG
jgi:hypothetical protein